MASRAKRINLDHIGATASMVCAVHCLITGVALGLLSMSGLAFVGSVWADLLFVGFALFVGIIAVVHGMRKHHSLIPAVVFCLSIGSITAAFFLVADRSIWHTIFSVCGGLGLVTFHVLNLRMGHNCQGGCSCAHEEKAA